MDTDQYNGTGDIGREKITNCVTVPWCTAFCYDSKKSNQCLPAIGLAEEGRRQNLCTQCHGQVSLHISLDISIVSFFANCKKNTYVSVNVSVVAIHSIFGRP